MKALLNKELKLCTPLQVPLFFVFAAMLLIPSYPYLVAGFFICNAVFYSFAMSTGQNDVLFSVLLPVSKKDIVRGKLTYVVCIQLVSMLLFTGMVFVNHAMYKDVINRGGTTASITLLAFYLLLYSVFNAVYIPGYFKAPHKFGIRFLKALIACFAVILICEGVMAASANAEGVAAFDFIRRYLNVFPTDTAALVCQLITLAVCVAVYAVTNVLVCKKAASNFEKLDI